MYKLKQLPVVIFAAVLSVLHSLRYRLALRSLIPIAGAAAGTVEGQRGTDNIGANVLEVDYEDSVAELEPSSAPLTLLTNKLDKTQCDQPKYNWFEDQLDIRFDQVNNGAGYNSAATSIVVDNGAYWQADDLIYVPRTGETLRIITVVATNTLTVVRGVGSTAAALVDNDELINTSSAAQQGALDKPAKSSIPTEVFNYTQIFRRPIDITGTARSSKNRIKPADWYRQLNKKGIEHAKDMEYQAMFGHPSKDTSGSQPRTTTGGFLHYATQNVTDVGGTMTEAEFFAALSPMFRYGSKVKAAFAARVPVDILHTFPRSKLFIDQSEKTFGIEVTEVVTPHGTVKFMTHWLLEGQEFSKHIWLVDLANVGSRYLHGDDGSRDTKVRQEIQPPGQDGRKDEYMTECGYEFRQPLTHGRIINITG